VSISVNELAWPLVESMLARAPQLRIATHAGAHDALIVDAGIAVAGSVAAGVAIAEICMGGLGRIVLREGASDGWPTWIDVASSQPVLACLASQYAGWSLAASKEQTGGKAGGKKFFSLGSGPARALVCKEELFAELAYRDSASRGALVLETDREPPAAVIEKVQRDCGLQGANLALILTPTTSLAGTTQVVARVLEVALHKVHVLGFPLADIVEGAASAPLPVPGSDGIEAMGRTNDAILYGGRAHLTVNSGDDAARDLAQRLPSSNSRDYGRSFAEVFREVDFDFYRIDPHLFAPAEVWVSSLKSGNTWHAGRINIELLRRLWLNEA